MMGSSRLFRQRLRTWRTGQSLRSYARRLRALQKEKPLSPYHEKLFLRLADRNTDVKTLAKALVAQAKDLVGITVLINSWIWEIDEAYRFEYPVDPYVLPGAPGATPSRRNIAEEESDAEYDALLEEELVAEIECDRDKEAPLYLRRSENSAGEDYGDTARPGYAILKVDKDHPTFDRYNLRFARSGQPTQKEKFYPGDDDVSMGAADTEVCPRKHGKKWRKKHKKSYRGQIRA